MRGVAYLQGQTAGAHGKAGAWAKARAVNAVEDRAWRVLHSRHVELRHLVLAQPVHRLGERSDEVLARYNYKNGRRASLAACLHALRVGLDRRAHVLHEPPTDERQHALSALRERLRAWDFAQARIAPVDGCGGLVPVPRRRLLSVATSPSQHLTDAVPAAALVFLLPLQQTVVPLVQPP
eukprot:scaffold272942_cov31-Tisochrysis_lutea.AAC.2